MMREDIARQIAAVPITTPVTPEFANGVRAAYLPYQETEPYAGLTVVRDARYGPDERNRLDVFSPVEAGASRPVVLFVHGGAYVRGDKRTPGTPYHDNVGVWAARCGFVGVNMTYRLAPAHPYPAGAADVGAALAWVRENIARYGGDPDAVTLLGHSAGATHVASYIALPELYAAPKGGAVAVALMAGNYDHSGPNPPPHVIAYFGEDPAVRDGANPIPAVVASNLPVLLVVSEFDSRAVHRQTKLFADALYDRDGRTANLLYMPRHNHISMLAHLNARGAGDDLLAGRLEEFIRTASAQPSLA